MARRGRRKKFKLKFNIQPATVRSIASLVLLLIAILSLISFFAPAYPANAKIQRVLKGSLGFPSVLLPFVLGMAGLIFIDKLTVKFKETRVLIGLFMLMLSSSSLFHVFISSDKAYELAKEGGGGGLIGYKIATILSNGLSMYGAAVLLLFLFVISIFLVFDISLSGIIGFFSEYEFTAKIIQGIKSRFTKDKIEGDDLGESMEVESGYVESGTIEDRVGGKGSLEHDYEGPDFQVLPTLAEPQITLEMKPGGLQSATQLDFPHYPSDKLWQYPSTSLLIDPPAEIKDNSDVEINKKVIVKTLRNFGIDVEVEYVKIGSSVTQYALKTNSITRISKIASLHEDLALALASSTGSIRIEAPIPGKSLIGIEVPNKQRSTVYFKSLIESDAIKNIKSKLGITLGKDVAGKTYADDISTMPHMLIAGATGSGKSVFIHNILFSLLYRSTPQEVKFILVDPKRVELIHYKGIPHLLTPIVTDMDKAPSVFRWAVEEMEKRYKLFEQAKVRNINAYNEKSGIQVMPNIVIVVDELAEIMVRDPSGVEKSIIRLAQLARATGVHLVLAVQRPSTNVITGLIKANIPCRVAFYVASQIDSRVIIDQPGAEKLLGKGDMLFVAPDAVKPIRLQGAFLSDKEIINVVSYLKSQGVEPEYKEEVLAMPSNTALNKGSDTWGDDVDELFDQSVEIVIASGKASASLLQRKLSIGYARAARIIDDMEEKGIIGPAQGGSKARDVLLDTMPSMDINGVSQRMPPITTSMGSIEENWEREKDSIEELSEEEYIS